MLHGDSEGRQDPAISLARENRRSRWGALSAAGYRRLTFGFPIVPELPQDLPRARKAWLLQLLADGQSRWRMVRIGLTRSRGVQAQVDLTGVPREVLEQLLPIGVDALRHVVRSLVEPADFLVNGAAACRAVEVRPKPKEGGNHDRSLRNAAFHRE